MALPRDIEVEMTFLPTEHGGRKGPAVSGYRPQFYYDGRDWDASHEYVEVERVFPGQTVRAYLTFASPQAHIGKLRPGQAFLIREGNKAVAYGAVVRVLDLERPGRVADNSPAKGGDSDA
jgi:elongation factor Tu